jgi:thermitase
MHLLRLIALTTLSLSCLTLLPAPVHGMGAGRDDTEQHVAGGRLPPPTLEEPVEVRRGGQVFQMKRVKTVQLPDGREAVAQRLIVGFQDGVDERARARVHAAVRALGVAPVAWAQLGPAAHVVNLGPTDSLERALAAYRAQRGVRYVEPDYVARLSFTPNDPVFSSQWGMSKIQAPGAWDVTRGSPLRYVAIVDCGIYEQGSTTYGPGHDDINGKVVKRVDFVNESELPDDFCNHGTHVAGIAAANTNNGLGVAGVGFDTRLLNVKACNWLGYCLTSDVTSGIYWAADNGAHVVNLSLSGPGPCTTTYQDAINYAWARNLIIVAAAGNDGSSSPSTPASCNNVLAVAATDQSDLRAYFSNYGSWVDVAAPGTSIWSTDFVGGYVTKSGTSMATPHVAGLAALVWAANPSLSNQGVVDRIKSTADRIPGTGTYWEAGRINAASAVRSQPPSNPLLQIDAPASGATVRGTVTVGGWALDRNAASGTGVDQVHLYLDAPAGQPGSIGLGVASYGGSRPDVGAAFGSQFTNSGWSFAWNTSGLSPGTHTLYVYARSTVSGQWTLQTVSVLR